MSCAPKAAYELREQPALPGERDEQWTGLPLRTLITALKSLHRRQDLVETDLVRVIHRSDSRGRKAVAGRIDDVDVRRALRDALVQDVRTFVDQGENHPAHNFVLRDFTGR